MTTSSSPKLVPIGATQARNYTKAEQGDHFLMFRNPFEFTEDPRAFLEH